MENAVLNEAEIDIGNAAPKKRSIGCIIGMVIGRFFTFIGVILLAAVILLVGASYIFCMGPSPSASDLFVNTMMETSALKFIPRMFFTEEEIDAIRKRNSTVETLEVTDQSLVVIPTPEELSEEEERLPLEIIDISSSTYKGKLMLVRDPSRVVLGTPPSLGGNAKGIQISEMVEREGGIAGINAGGFLDEGGVGNGGTPLGIVIKNGELLYNGGGSIVVGFDKDNKLVVGWMTAQEAMDKGLRDACSFGPVFIVNGKRSDVAGTGGGLNPRTCIGQTADGTVLLLTIDGRQATSIGATYEDCINILEEYGAVNAANLDGGSSTVMYYNGEIINVCASVYGPRDLPTAFVVLPEKTN
ncbi:MAG: phosphodiester glycosidase family protein [Oscillospiraceae bacterium]|nr:phosphodiester glycosidase family protein [Oscillospiraceae bacterium]